MVVRSAVTGPDSSRVFLW